MQLIFLQPYWRRKAFETWSQTETEIQKILPLRKAVFRQEIKPSNNFALIGKITFAFPEVLVLYTTTVVNGFVFIASWLLSSRLARCRNSSSAISFVYDVSQVPYFSNNSLDLNGTFTVFYIVIYFLKGYFIYTLDI